MRARTQRGMSFLSTIVVIFVAGVFLTVAFKLGPHYLDNNIIQGAIDQVGAKGLDDKTEPQIRRELDDFFTVNNVREIDLKQVKLVREKHGTRIVLDYEKRVPMFGNVDAVIVFHNEFDSSKQGN